MVGYGIRLCSSRWSHLILVSSVIVSHRWRSRHWLTIILWHRRWILSNGHRRPVVVVAMVGVEMWAVHVAALKWK